MKKQPHLSKNNQRQQELAKRVRDCEQRWLESMDKLANNESELFEQYMAANDEWAELYKQYVSKDS
jgi:hypothetical protein